jgi:hypothetical protein
MLDPSELQAIASKSLSTDRVRHLTQLDLARRWRMSPRTLERWRYQQVGPSYLKMEGHVIYTAEDVCAYEAQKKKGGGI